VPCVRAASRAHDNRLENKMETQLPLKRKKLDVFFFSKRREKGQTRNVAQRA
jgi:hypothetical protein